MYLKICRDVRTKAYLCGVALFAFGLRLAFCGIKVAFPFLLGLRKVSANVCRYIRVYCLCNPNGSHMHTHSLMKECEVREACTQIMHCVQTKPARFFLHRLSSALAALCCTILLRCSTVEAHSTVQYLLWRSTHPESTVYSIAWLRNLQQHARFCLIRALRQAERSTRALEHMLNQQ